MPAQAWSPGIEKEEDRHRPLGLQPASARRRAATGLQRHQRFTWRSRVLRRITCSAHRPSRRIAPAQQPSRRHPARLSQDSNPLRRDYGLGTPGNVDQHSHDDRDTRWSCFPDIGALWAAWTSTGSAPRFATPDSMSSAPDSTFATVRVPSATLVFPLAAIFMMGLTKRRSCDWGRGRWSAGSTELVDADVG